MPIHPSAHPNSWIMRIGFFHGVVDDIVFADRVHAVDGQGSISVEARPGSHGRLERIALLARQAMVVAGRVHVEAAVHQVVDVRLLGMNLSRYAMPSLSMAGTFVGGVAPDRLVSLGSLLLRQGHLAGPSCWSSVRLGSTFAVVPL